jgi:hypothetical protein
LLGQTWLIINSATEKEVAFYKATHANSDFDNDFKTNVHIYILDDQDVVCFILKNSFLNNFFQREVETWNAPTGFNMVALMTSTYGKLAPNPGLTTPTVGNQ